MGTSKDPGGAASALALPAREARPLRLLVVDDDRVNRLILSAMLEHDGHVVIQAENGAEAVARYEYDRPDMVLMDVMMPVMDGYEATRAIKARAGRHFLPVIFLTALTDDASLARCVEAGGDDFLTKPYSRVLLEAKMRALLRTRALAIELERRHDALAIHHQRLQQEQVLAERLFRSIVHRGCLDAPSIRYLISPTALFNGDLLLAARHPSGGLRVLLGDFAGHGLRAAVGAIPVSELFYTMTAKGYSISETVGEINRKLHGILPVGQFLAACLADIDRSGRQLTIWNGGIPDALVRSADGRLRRLASQHLPLGVVHDDALDRNTEVLDLAAGDRLYLYTDGVTEARNDAGRMFGQERVEEVLSEPMATFATLCARLAEHRGRAANAVTNHSTSRSGTVRENIAPQDDISLIEISPLAENGSGTGCDEAPRGTACAASEWRLSLELSAATLRSADPLPGCLHMVMDLQGIHEHRERIYLILSELFNNALDHGLLRLDSGIKNTPGGFAEYYAARERALATLSEGRIRLAVQHAPTARGGRLAVHIEDSGSGFCGARVAAPLAANTQPSGRGLALLRSLCREVIFRESGNHVEAIYEWSD